MSILEFFLEKARIIIEENSDEPEIIQIFNSLSYFSKKKKDLEENLDLQDFSQEFHLLFLKGKPKKSPKKLINQNIESNFINSAFQIKVTIIKLNIFNKNNRL